LSYHAWSVCWTISAAWPAFCASRPAKNTTDGEAELGILLLITGRHADALALADHIKTWYGS